MNIQQISMKCETQKNSHSKLFFIILSFAMFLNMVILQNIWKFST